MPYACPICAYSPVITKVSKVEGIWPRDHTVLYCSSCSSYFLEDMPTEAELQSYYRAQYYQSSVGKAKDSIKHLFREFRTANQASFIMQSIRSPTPLKILEIGAGDGRLLWKVRPLAEGRFEKLHGLELSPYYVDYAQKKWGLKLQDQDFFSLTGPYDLILMSHVFEHFVDLAKVVDHLRRLLSPGGYLFVEVPHSPSPKEVSPQDLAHFLNTTHTYNFTAPSIRAFWERAGYQVLAAQRSTYHLPRFVDAATRTQVAKVFLEGRGLGWKTAWYALVYLLGHTFAPETSYTTIPWDSPYWGPGDNVRLMLKIG
jgi:SAM-dependent methyltransferase